MGGNIDVTDMVGHYEIHQMQESVHNHIFVEDEYRRDFALSVCPELQEEIDTLKKTLELELFKTVLELHSIINEQKKEIDRIFPMYVEKQLKEKVVFHRMNKAKEI